MTWKPNIVTRQAIQGFISDLFATAPEIMGIDEAIAGCEVILMDPYTTGALPRYIRVRIREYYQDVIWRGSPSLVVGGFCTVLHFRDGNRYEVIGASGAGGVDLSTPYISIWVYDVSEGLIIPYDTINNALGYAALAVGDFILIPPGTFNESVTLVNGVYICEQIPGTVTLDWTVASGAWTNGTVIVADGGYINVRNIYRTPVAGLDYNAVFIPVAFAGVCTIIAENIRSTGPGNSTRGIYFRGTGGGTLHVHAKTLTAITPTGVTAAAYYEGTATGVINLYVERGYASGATNGYGIWVNGATVNVYGGEWEGIGGTAGYGWIVVASGTLTGLHARAIGSRHDLRNTGGTLQIFQVQYNSFSTVGATIDHLPGDHIVLDLDADTYVSALLADDRIDFYVAGAPPTNIRLLANNVVSLVDGIAQAFSIADVGGTEFLRLDTANDYFLIDPAAAGIDTGFGTATPSNILDVERNQSAFTAIEVRNTSNNAAAVAGFDIYGEVAHIRLLVTSSGHGASPNIGWMGTAGAHAFRLGVNDATSITIDPAGNVVIGALTSNAVFMVHGTNGEDIAIDQFGIYRYDTDLDDRALCINYVGYEGGVTRFRDVCIYDGKNNLILFVDGSTGVVKIASLAGVGVRAVVAAADGTLSAP